jgi:putative dimethyl sulfoxide reductase chaperone
MSESRATVYAAFSECLKDPSPSWRDEIPSALTVLNDAFSQLMLPFDLEGLTGALANAPDLPVAYTRSFIFPMEHRVVPVESVYRVWTKDSTATVSFAHSKGYLMGDSALHMQHLYGLHSLTIPTEYASFPDHLCLELEFASLLLQRGESDKYVIFLREHLDWVSELTQEAVEKEIPLFYRLLLQALDNFLAYEGKAAK